MRSALTAAALTTAGALLALTVAIPYGGHPTAPIPAPTANQEPRR